MSTQFKIDDIDEQEILQSIAGYSFSKDFKLQKEQKENAQTASTEANATNEQSTQSEMKRIGSKQRKASFEEFRQQFMKTPKIDDRKPVFISLATRDNLDRIVRLFGERGLSVSGLVENLTKNFLETYRDDVEQWRKM